MEHYGPYVVHMLASLEKPEELCSYIDMCDAVPGLVKIDPNFDHCSLGPKYFCAKKKRAELCNVRKSENNILHESRKKSNASLFCIHTNEVSMVSSIKNQS